jgi:hypothetical protein
MHHGFRPLDRKKNMVPVISKWTMASRQCRELNAVYDQILTGCHPEIELSEFDFIAL